MSDRDFLLDGYRDILASALANDYRFTAFDSIGREACAKSCLLRHDVDSELLDCGPVLDIEKSLGVKATYFVMTRSTAYNLFCVEARDMVARMLADGHRIGLHFMGELCEGDDARTIADKVAREAAWLAQEFGTLIDSVSFHQPTRAILDGDLEIPGLVNTYNRRQMGDYFYVSDTNMQWRHEHPLEIFARAIYPRLQLLMHPMWWTAKGLDVRDKWTAVLDANREHLVRHWKMRERTLERIDLASPPTGLPTRHGLA